MFISLPKIFPTLIISCFIYFVQNNYSSFVLIKSFGLTCKISAI